MPCSELEPVSIPGAGAHLVGLLCPFCASHKEKKDLSVGSNNGILNEQTRQPDFTSDKKRVAETVHLQLV